MRKIFFLLILLISTSIYPEDTPKRIISLAPSFTKAIYLLGGEERLIANTIYCPKLPSEKRKEKIGTFLDINIEKIYSLKPDLILANPLNKSSEVEKLKKLGLKVVVISEPKNFSQLCENFLKIGKILGKEKEAKEIIKKVKEKIEIISKKTKNLKRKRVFIEVGVNPLFTVTKNSFINDYIEYGGGINIAKDFPSGIISEEEVLKRNPEVIIVSAMGINSEKEVERWKKFKFLSAVKNNQIYIIEDEDLTSPTPLSFVKVLEKITKIIHPK